MPIKSSLGALRQFIDSSDLTKIYFLDLFKTSAMAGGFFDSLGHYHFMATDADKMVELDTFNNASNVKLYSNSAGVGNIANFDLAEDHTLLLKFSLASSLAGCSKIDADTYTPLGTISRANTILGNVQIESSGDYVFTGQHATTDEGVVVSSVSSAKYITKPGLPGPGGYTFRILATDGVTDGTNTYVGGSFESTNSAIKGGFLIKIDQFGSLVWDRSIGVVPTNIKLIDGNANLLLATTYVDQTSIIISKIATANGIGVGNRYQANNVVATSPATIETQSLDVDASGNIVVGGQYKSSSGVGDDGFIIGLDSSMTERFKKSLTGTMPGPPSMSIKNVSMNQSLDVLCIAGSNFDTSNSYGTLLSVPYDGTSPGTGSYVLSGVTTTYQNTSNISGSVITPGTGSAGNIVLTSATGIVSNSFSLSNSTFSFSSLEI